MILSLENFLKVYESILSGQITREDADRWAYSIVKLDEIGSVRFNGSEFFLRSHLMFVYGVDSQESPGVYIHSDDEILKRLRKIQFELQSKNIPSEHPNQK